MRKLLLIIAAICLLTPWIQAQQGCSTMNSVDLYVPQGNAIFVGYSGNSTGADLYQISLTHQHNSGTTQQVFVSSGESAVEVFFTDAPIQASDLIQVSVAPGCIQGHWGDPLDDSWNQMWDGVEAVEVIYEPDTYLPDWCDYACASYITITPSDNSEQASIYEGISEVQIPMREACDVINGNQVSGAGLTPIEALLASEELTGSANDWVFTVTHVIPCLTEQPLPEVGEPTQGARGHKWGAETMENPIMKYNQIAIYFEGLNRNLEYNLQLFNIEGRLIQSNPVFEQSSIRVVESNHSIIFASLIDENGEVVITESLMLAQ